jgi:hypothetical protein
VTSAINGLPAVHFDANDETFLGFNRPVENDFTIFLVFRSSQGVGTGPEFYQGAGLVNGEVAFVVNDFGMSLNADGEILAGTGNPDTFLVSDPGFNNGQAHLAVFRRERTTGAIELWVDGVLEASDVGGLQSLTSPPRLVLGAQQTEEPGDYLTGDIAEVKIYDAALSTDDRLAEENALSCKYDLGPGGLPGAPSGLAAAAGNRAVNLSWDAVVGAFGYSLSRSATAGGPYTLVDDNLTATEYIDTGAVSGQTNYYKVASFTDCGDSPESDAVAVFLPLPLMSVAVDTGEVTLSWPDWADDWILSSATNLSPPVVWTPVTNSAITTNGRFVVTLSLGSADEFFRLASP